MHNREQQCYISEIERTYLMLINCIIKCIRSNRKIIYKKPRPLGNSELKYSSQLDNEFAKKNFLRHNSSPHVHIFSQINPDNTLKHSSFSIFLTSAPMSSEKSFPQRLSN